MFLQLHMQEQESHQWSMSLGDSLPSAAASLPLTSLSFLHESSRLFESSQWRFTPLQTSCALSSLSLLSSGCVIGRRAVNLWMGGFTTFQLSLRVNILLLVQLDSFTAFLQNEHPPPPLFPVLCLWRQEVHYLAADWPGRQRSDGVIWEKQTN